MNKIKKWNLIESDAYSGKFNMTYDRWLFEQIQTDAVGPTLRFFQWSKPTISYGMNQKNIEEIVDFERCRDEGVDVVKRPTGGRELLHGYDLSYSVAARLSDFDACSKSINAVCTLIHNAIVKGLIDSGLDKDGFLAGAKLKNGYDLKAKMPCFTSMTGNEIAYNGKKLVGSAQRKEKESILQHGSIQIISGTSGIANLLLLKDEVARNRLRDLMIRSVTSVSAEAGYTKNRISLLTKKLQENISKSFSLLLGITFELKEIDLKDQKMLIE
ncbi:MAG: hypothetical protein GF307_00145 [candidate division Zixibacteria bacterium]|nr:hypothetical protein [candidate division Zixibacteria bacterium]